MSNSGLLSVIIPVHNRTKLFGKCITSVISQNYSPVEIIVVDDASRPSIKSYLSKNKFRHPKEIKLIRNTTKKGPAISRNQGLKIAKGKYVAFLDSDDVWQQSFASEMISFLEKERSGLITCILRPRFIGKLSSYDKLFYFLLSLSRNLCFYLMFLLNNGRLDKSFFYMTRLSGMIFRKKALKEFRFNFRFESAEDWEFVYNITYLNKSEISILPRTLADFTYHKNSETLGRSNYFKYYLDLLNKIPSRLRQSIGIRLFKAYITFAIWRKKKK